MSKKVIFKIDKDLDFKNHLIGARVSEKDHNYIPPETIEYFKSLRNSDENKQKEIFEKRSSRFYSGEIADIRILSVKQIQEMWNLVEDKYFNKIEEIHQKKFPLEAISGILSTTPMIYGYNFNGDNPWFACPYDSPIKAVNTAMHEIMHTFFHEYFMKEYQNKFELSDSQIWDIKEAVTIILNLEFNDIRFLPDRGKKGHEKLREKIKEDWFKYKDFNKVLKEACVFIKKM